MMRSIGRYSCSFLLVTSLLAQEKGREVFRACQGCHNVLTDARKSGPSLRTLFGKVRLINGKRATEQNVMELVTEGYNAMPSYKYILHPQDWQELMLYLKTLRARPEIAPVLRPVRGSDEDVLKAGKSTFVAECQRCHTTSKLGSGALPEEAEIVRLIREGHGEATFKQDVFDDAALFSLVAYLKATAQQPTERKD